MGSIPNFSVIPANETDITGRVGWVNDPDGRGTFSLVVSCLSTLLLCVYSAMHLNLPMYHESGARYVWRYCKWALIGVLGPELVVWTAWRQYISAHALRNEIREMKTPITKVTVYHSRVGSQKLTNQSGGRRVTAAPVERSGL